jgi:hypothetical protein
VAIIRGASRPLPGLLFSLQSSITFDPPTTTSIQTIGTRDHDKVLLEPTIALSNSSKSHCFTESMVLSLYFQARLWWITWRNGVSNFKLYTSFAEQELLTDPLSKFFSEAGMLGAGGPVSQSNLINPLELPNTFKGPLMSLHQHHHPQSPQPAQV